MHHGNGTQHTFYDDARVLFISLHQYPFYPGTGSPRELGRGEGLGHTANVALPARARRGNVRVCVRSRGASAARSLRAGLVLVSAGFDAHARDPLAQMALDSASYQAMASALIASVERAGHGRIAFLLEGGYDLRALEQSVQLVGRALAGDSDGAAARDATRRRA